MIVSRRAPTAVVPSGFVTMTSHSRLFFGPPERIYSVAVSCVEPSRTTFSTRGVWPPVPFTNATLAPVAKPVPVITKLRVPTGAVSNIVFTDPARTSAKQ